MAFQLAEQFFMVSALAVESRVGPTSKLAAMAAAKVKRIGSSMGLDSWKDAGPAPRAWQPDFLPTFRHKPLLGSDRNPTMSRPMGLFDQLESRCEEIAGKAGIPPETVRSMSASLQEKMNQQGVDHMEALEAVAMQHGLPVDKVQEVLSHCGSEQDMMSGLTGLAGGLFNKG